MENRNKKTTDQLTIGSKCYLVHKGYAFKNKIGGRIVPARVSTFVNTRGEVEPEFVKIGNSKQEMTMKNYVPFVDVQSAIDSIVTNK